jgi:hypothetical protein
MEGMATPHPNHRWFRFSLGTLLALMFVACLFFGVARWLGMLTTAILAYVAVLVVQLGYNSEAKEGG